ncbi:HAD-IA family hydrolase [Hoeflea sp.]|uniref:HAD-IA family hydrolase n=1 Tax=Hoeflea sp. TaxID=1940281 RepID=UPI00374A90E1
MLDVDGVLVDGRPEDGRSWAFSLREDLGIDPEMLVSSFFSKVWGDIVTGKRELVIELTKVLRQLPTDVTAEELVDYWFEMDSRIVEPVLEDCRAARQSGVALYLATNQEHLRARYLMETLGLGREFDGMIYSAQAGVRKPFSGFYDHALRVSGFAPEALLFVDDTQANVDAAADAGLRAVHWTEGASLSAILKSATG